MHKNILSYALTAFAIDALIRHRVNHEIIVASSQPLDIRPQPHMPAVIAAAGASAGFAYDEFLYGTISNEHTRIAYRHAINRFLAWIDGRSVTLPAITPKMVREYLDQMTSGIANQKKHLAAIRHFFDIAVTRHAVILNPAASVRGQRYQVVEGKTPMIGIDQARRLLESINLRHVVGLRDRAMIATLIYTAARVSAVAKLRRGDLYDAGDQWYLRLMEKGGKSREIPVRHDLQRFIHEYLDRAGIFNDTTDAPLFRAAIGSTKVLTKRPFAPNDVCRMMKRRLRDAELPTRLSPHSFRVATITDLLTQGVPLEDVQYLAGHADPRTTRLYDRRNRKVTRNIVERISV